jgi:hypothetical protein
MKWIDKEKGPLCFCGMPTFVSVADDGEADLVCIFHEREAGALFHLPTDGRTENWPDLNDQEVDVIMLKGMEEQTTKDGQESNEDKHSVPSRTLN